VGSWQRAGPPTWSRIYGSPYEAMSNVVATAYPDFTDEFTNLATVLGPALDGQAVVLDGEVVAYNAPQLDPPRRAVRV
jgi:hypothetical protein